MMQRQGYSAHARFASRSTPPSSGRRSFRDRAALGLSLLSLSGLLSHVRPAAAETPPARQGTDIPSTPLTRAASDPPAADRAEQARQLYTLGAEAFGAQRNADAIGYFRRAAEFVPNPKLSYNIALAYEEMGDTGRALAEYRAYLRNGAALELRAAVLLRARELEQKLVASGVQQLSVLSEPAGASVNVGGRLLGVTPWSGELPPGVQHIMLELAGHEPRSADVVLSVDRAAEVRLALPVITPPPAHDGERGAFSRIEPLTWSFLGVGLGALGGGIAFEVSRAASSDRAGSAAAPLDAAEARGAADAKQMASLLLFGFGTAFLIGGGVLMTLDLSHAPAARPGSEAPRAPASGAQAHLVIPCSPGFCGLAAEGRF